MSDRRVGTRGPGRLFRKYVVVFVLLVTGALLTSGVVQLYFAYQESRTAQAQIQQEKVHGAAREIEAFVRDVERQIAATVQAPRVAGVLTPEQRRADYLRLLNLVPAITDLSYL